MGGPITLAVTSVNSARRSALRNAELVGALANALPASTRLLILTNDRPAFEILRNPHPGRVDFVEVPPEVPITIWPQDPFLVLTGNGRPPVLLASRHFERAGDREMALALGRALDWEVRTSGLAFEGGNVLADERHAFIGANTIRGNAAELGVNEVEVARFFEAELGLPVVVIGPVPQPVGHIDMMLTPLGEDRLLLADPGAGAEVAERLLADDPDAAARFEQTSEAYFFGHPDIRALPARDGGTIRAPSLLGGTRRAAARSRELVPYFDALAKALEAGGYEILRAPFLASLALTEEGNAERPYREALDYPVITYNNAVLEHAGHARRVYLPTYGLAALDEAGQHAWERIGYEVHAVPGFAVSALYGGALRCTLKVLRRE